MLSKEEHLSLLESLGFGSSMLESFAKEWKALEDEGYEMYAIYRGAGGSALQDKAACAVCSKNSLPLRWEKVITPSMDSAAIYSVCSECDAQYVAAAIKQKALGRLLKERNTRSS